MPPDLEARIRNRLQELTGSGLRRVLKPPAGFDFSSNDYLGLAEHPLLKQRMIEAIRHEGCGSTGSRLLRGHRGSFEIVESEFAKWKDTEASLFFSSGYAANLGVLSTFLEPGDIVFSDERNHASIIDGIRLGRARCVVFAHSNVADLAGFIEKEPCAGQRFLVTESLFSMDGDVAPLPDYAKLCRAAGVAMIVDEAHAVGIYGTRGSGLIEEQGVRKDVFLSVNTAGKALGVCGAFVAGPSWAIDYLIQGARPFLFSTAPPPTIAVALQESLLIIKEEPHRRTALKERCLLLRRILKSKGIPVPEGYSQIIPVVIGDNSRACKIASCLQEEGFDVRAIRPPSVPPGTARLRISVNIKIEESILLAFADALAKTY